MESSNKRHRKGQGSWCGGIQGREEAENQLSALACLHGEGYSGGCCKIKFLKQESLY